MKYYHIIFWILKIMLISALLLIYTGYIDASNNFYHICDKLLKLLIGIFIIYLFTVYTFPMIEFHDLIIILAGGYLLLFSAFINQWNSAMSADIPKYKGTQIPLHILCHPDKNIKLSINFFKILFDIWYGKTYIFIYKEKTAPK